MQTVVRTALSLVTAALLNFTPSYAQTTSPLIGGEPITPGSKPWMASLLYKGASRSDVFKGHFCGGTLIAPSTVLTAAHCVTNSAGETISSSSIEVYIGDAPRSSSIGAKRNVSAVIVHPDYESILANNDFALIKLDQSVNLSPMPLLTDEESGLAAPGTSATALGWGIMDPAESVFPDKLQQVTLPLVSSTTCEDNLGLLFNSSAMICAGALSANRLDIRNGTCYGDSGGPLLVPNGSDGWKQAGIVSWGFGCGAPRHYDVFSKVSAAVNWINSSPAIPPKNVTRPSIESLTTGTLTCSKGTWDSSDLTFSYRWVDSLLRPLIDGDRETLILKPEYQNRFLACIVKAQNQSSATRVISNFVSFGSGVEATPSPTPTSEPTPSDDPKAENDPEIRVVRSGCRKATCTAVVEATNLSNVAGVQADVKFVGKLACPADASKKASCDKKRITQRSNIFAAFNTRDQLFYLRYKVKGTGKVTFKITVQDIYSNWSTVPVITTMKISNPG